jgi:ribosomal protein S6E (S10)
MREPPACEDISPGTEERPLVKTQETQLMLLDPGSGFEPETSGIRMRWDIIRVKHVTDLSC